MTRSNKIGRVIEDGSGGKAVESLFPGSPKPHFPANLLSAVPAVAAVGLVHLAQK